MRFVVIFLLIFAFCFGESLQQIKELQKCLAKDFIIYQTLKEQNISSDDAKELLGQIYRLSPKLEYEFHQKIEDKEFNFAYNCKKLPIDDFAKVSNECLYLALSPKKVQKLPFEEQKKIYQRLEKNYKDKLTWLESMLKSDIFLSLESGDGKDFIKVFLGVDDEFKKRLDRRLSNTFLEQLQKQKGFENFVIFIAQNSSYHNIATSLINANYQGMTYDTNFYLGILSILHEENSLAIKFFYNAYKRTDKDSLKDKAMFWVYQTTKNRDILKILSNSSSFNIYALYAKEIFNKSYDIITFNPTKDSLKNYSITDPFTWEATKTYIKNFNKIELEKFSERFFTKETLPHYVFMQQRINGYKKIYFITPYSEYIKNFDTKRKALIYAIARQESRHIPVDVSTSYALGLMQFMPFLAKAVAEDLEFKNFIYDDMFKPLVALKFANYHLDYLQTYLFNPLLVAYAYNGGIGFTRRVLNKLFTNNLHEPFLSMELIPYSESREYGKKVLANYIIYSKIYGFNVDIRKVFQNLKQPSLSYRFAK